MTDTEIRNKLKESLLSFVVMATKFRADAPAVAAMPEAARLLKELTDN